MKGTPKLDTRVNRSHKSPSATPENVPCINSLRLKSSTLKPCRQETGPVSSYSFPFAYISCIPLVFCKKNILAFVGVLCRHCPFCLRCLFIRSVKNLFKNIAFKTHFDGLENHPVEAVYIFL